MFARVRWHAELRRPHMQDTPLRRTLERKLVNWCACGWVASWNGVIKYHGPKPVPKRNHIWVANHSSMIDYTVLTAYMPFAAIMQLQPGWVGFLQQRVLSCLGCLWFHRTEVLLFFVFLTAAVPQAACCTDRMSADALPTPSVYSLTNACYYSGYSSVGVQLCSPLPRRLQPLLAALSSQLCIQVKIHPLYV